MEIGLHTIDKDGRGEDQHRRRREARESRDGCDRQQQHNTVPCSDPIVRWEYHLVEDLGRRSKAKEARIQSFGIGIGIAMHAG